MIRRAALVLLFNTTLLIGCMQPFIDTKFLNKNEKSNLRLLRVALDACKQDSRHFFNYMPGKSPYTPLALAQSTPNFYPLAQELIQHKERKTSAPSTVAPIDQKALNVFENYRLRALLFYLDACRANPIHLNRIMPYTVPDLPLSIAAGNDAFLPITKELIKIGAKPNRFNHTDWGHSPIFKAIQHDARKTISYLIRHGALLFFIRKTKKHEIKIIFGNSISPEKLWSKKAEAFSFAHREFALRMLLLCRQKEGCILQYAPKDVLKHIVAQIN